MGRARFLVPALAGLAVAFGLSGHAAAADAPKTYVMKVSLATINDTQHEWVKMFVAAVEKDSGGRIKGEIYPASQLGSIPRQIEGVQFGAIQCWVGPPEFLVGVDERFEVMSAPGLFTSLEQAGRIAAKPEVKDMVLGFGRDKGLVGVSLFPYGASSVATRSPVHHLTDFKGLKIRVLASPFQNELISRLGGTPVAMTLGDVLPAIQQGTIDGTVSAMPVFTTMHYKDAAKYVVEIGQPFIFSVAEVSKKWFDTLPPDLQKIITDEGQKNATAIVPWVETFFAAQRKAWVADGGELNSLPPDEQATMMTRLASIGDDMSKTRPALNRSFKALAAAVQQDK